MQNMTKRELIAEVEEIYKLIHNVKVNIWDIQKALSGAQNKKYLPYVSKYNMLTIFTFKNDKAINRMSKIKLKNYIIEITENLQIANNLMKEGLEML